MNFNHLKTAMICLLAVCIQITHAGTQQVNIERSFMVGDGIAPTGYDAKKIPSFALQSEPRKKGELASNWTLMPEFFLNDGKAGASLAVPEGTSLYGGGEVTGTLLRNGKTIKLWNTDSGAYILGLWVYAKTELLLVFYLILPGKPNSPVWMTR